MKSAFRITALAATWAVLACSANAAPVEIRFDFEDLGQAATDKLTPQRADYSSTGLRISGGWVYDYNMLGKGLKPTETEFTLEDSSNQGGFLVNRARDAITQPIEFSIAGYPGRYFTSLSYRAFTAADSPGATGYTADPKDPGLFKAITAGGKTWIPGYTANVAKTLTASTLNDPAWLTTTFDSQDQIVRVVFSSADSGLLGLDDLVINLSDASTSGGNNVPEPAGYALVGLALLAAGAAGRSRRV